MSRLPLIIGHRGASALAPENTLAAFRRAIADGADGIEFDVRLSRDGVAVVIHDRTLERTGLVRQHVSDLTAADLNAIDVGTWFNRSHSPSAASDLTVPLLAQVFDLFREQPGVLYLEMKADAGSEDDLATEVARMVGKSQLRNRIIVECFELKAIQKVKELDSSIRTAALFEPKLFQPRSLVSRHLPEIAQAHGADEIALHQRLASARAIEQAKKLGQEVVIWTVDNPTWVTKARTLGVKALITNNPAPLLAGRDSDSEIAYS